MNLDRVERIADREVTDECLRDRGLDLMLGPDLLEVRRAVNSRAAHLKIDFHLGDLVGDGLEPRDRLTELVPLLRIADRLVERCLHTSDAAGEHDGALPVEAFECDAPERLVAYAEYAIVRHSAVGQHDLGGRRRAAAELVE